jgi:RNA polymerase sigma-70 factor (ECF subfamily)
MTVSDDFAESAETKRLLMKIRAGDRDAFEELFDRHRDSVRRAVELRLTPELKARFDASDVVQEAHLEAYQRLDEYLKREPMPFGLWVRKTAQQRLQKLKRAHLHAKQRTVHREQSLPDKSSMMLAARFVDPATSLGQRMAKQEYEQLVQDAINELEELDREILLMRIVEGLEHSEIGQLLDLNCTAVRKRFGRALIKLQCELTEKGLSRSMP